MAVGGLSVAVPGELSGLLELHRRAGRLPWAALFQPAARLADQGLLWLLLLYAVVPSSLTAQQDSRWIGRWPSPSRRL